MIQTNRFMDFSLSLQRPRRAAFMPSLMEGSGSDEEAIPMPAAESSSAKELGFR
jgi:hypothetical protein